MKSAKSIQTLRVLSLATLAFFLIGSYALSRPAIDSLFLKHHSSEDLPKVWLLTAFFAAIVMAIYNRYNTRHSLLKLFSVAALLSAGVLAACLIGYQLGMQSVVYPLYIWKEIYIVLLVEIFWSFSDVVFNIKSARWIYGILLGMGSAGGFIGNLVVGPLAKSVGTAESLWWVLPVLFACWFISALFTAAAGETLPVSDKSKKIPPWGQSLNVVKNSKYLFPLLILIGVVQISISLIDYQFNAALQLNYPDTDIRTDIMGKAHAAIDMIAVVLQLLSGPILRLLGVAGCLMTIPLILGTAVMTFLVVPQFLTMVAVKITSKCFDYSLFRAAKEILYIPLERDEKTQGKALIDILMYRIAKGLSSLLLLGLVYVGAISYAMPITFGLLIIWSLLTYVIVKRYRTVVSIEEEFAP